MSSGDLSQLVSRLEVVCNKLESHVNMPHVQGNQNDGGDFPLVRAYDQIVSGPLAQFVNLSEKIGSHVKAHAGMVAQAFNNQRQFIRTANSSREPDKATLVNLLKPTADQIAAIQAFRESNRTSPFFNHLSAISESIPVLGWVTVAATPAPFVKEMVDAGQFYTNRVLVEYKNKDQTHIDWVKAWIQTLSELQVYVKQNYTTGLTWNAKGKPVSGAGGPPPPPPMVDLSTLPDPTPSSVGDTNKAALFAELNKGSDVTKGLKKVTADQQTHKNPALKELPPVTSKPMPGPKPFKSNTTTASKPPKLALEGKKWVVENHHGNKEIVLSDVTMNQVVYIYNCVDSVIQVKGKVNSITMDACKKSSLVFDDLVSTVEIINSQSIQAQTLGKVPTILIAKTDGCQIYLSKSSLDAEIVTSKSSEMNLLIPTADGDFTEHPVPEQYKTVWTGKGLKTEVVEQA